MKLIVLMMIVVMYHSIIYAQSTDPDNPIFYEVPLEISSSSLSQGYYYSYTAKPGGIKLIVDGTGENTVFKVQILDDDFTEIEMIEFLTSMPLVRKVKRIAFDKEQKIFIKVITPNSENAHIKLRIESMDLPISPNSSDLQPRSDLEKSPNVLDTTRLAEMPENNVDVNLETHQNDLNSGGSNNDPPNHAQNNIKFTLQNGEERVVECAFIKITSNNKDKVVLEIGCNILSELEAVGLVSYEAHVVQGQNEGKEKSTSEPEMNSYNYSVDTKAQYFLNKSMVVKNRDGVTISGRYSTYTCTFNETKNKLTLTFKGKKIPKFDASLIASLFIER
jgi:hypothetical protein